VTSYLARRLLHAVATIVVAVALVFLAIRIIPGNPLVARFGQHPDLKQIQRLREEYGFDQPVLVQLGKFYWQLLTRADLGRSLSRPNRSISAELAERIPATIELTLAAVLLSVPLGIAAGVIAAVWRNRWPDRLAMLVALGGVSIPVFFLGIVLRSIFTILPTSQRLPIHVLAELEPITGLNLVDTLLQGRIDWFGYACLHLLLPAVVLSTVPMAIIARITRSSMLEALGHDCIRTARAKGASLWRVVLRHALPTAAVPVTNIAGLQVGLLLSGAVLTETIFDWPGLGRYIADSVVHDMDYVAVQGAAIIIATMFVSINLVLDVLYVWLDPRIRLT
jgi:peptide/nickel transport system permease protein